MLKKERQRLKREGKANNAGKESNAETANNKETASNNEKANSVEKAKKFLKLKKVKTPLGRKKILLAAGILVITLSAGGGFLFLLRRQAGDQTENMNGIFANSFTAPEGMGQGNVFMASGMTAVGMTTQDFEVEDLDARLYIEEVYVSNNSEIEEGTQILKISEDSLADARKELEKKAKETHLAYRAGAIEYEQSKISAEYDYNKSVLEGTWAKEVYEETLTGLSDQVEQAEEELAEANEKIAEYEKALSEGTYKTEYPYEKLKALYDENLKLLTDKMSEWGVTWEQVTGGGMRAGNQNASILASLYSILEQNLKDYEEAEEQYNTAVQDADIQLQKTKLGLSTLQGRLLEAREEKEKQEIQAKVDLESSQAKAEQARKDYETALKKAEAAYESLEADKLAAEKNLQLFEESIGDGYYYADSSGTVVMLPYRAQGYLEPDSMVLAYSNKEEVSVSVNVDQSDIAALQVGDECTVQLADYGTYQGKITEINPISESDSKTTVTYVVTVELEGDVSGLTSNLSATVLFGIGGADESTE